MQSMTVDKREMEGLIKGERSAVETYRQVLEKYGTDPRLDKLREFSVDHKNAVRDLTAGAKVHDVDIPETSGAWGSWAKIFTGAAKKVGEPTALKALRDGEEHGLKLYQDALEKKSSIINCAAKVAIAK